jgi:hypothetical protein
MKIFKCFCMGCHAPETSHGFTVFVSAEDPKDLFVEWRRFCDYHARAYHKYTFKTKQEALAYIVEQKLCH